MMISLSPIDTICVCDSRPKLGGDSFGRGARWPLGPTLHGSLRSSLLSEFGEIGKSAKGRKGKTITSHAFNWMGIKGPLPYHKSLNQILYPVPADIYCCTDGHFHMAEWKKSSSRGEPSCPFLPIRKNASKKKHPAEWINQEVLNNYINGKNIGNIDAVELFVNEHKIGIALNKDGMAVDGKIYGSQHARFREEISLFAEIVGTERASQPEMDCLKGMDITLFGGESRVCEVAFSEAKFEIIKPEIEGNFVKWTLLSPAVFLKGNMPDFLDEAGNVKLKKVVRGPQRKVLEEKSVDGKLVGMCLSPTVTISRFDTGRCSPKQVFQAVGAGSVYLFQSQNPKQLVDILHNRCLSSFLGEKGLGWGICSQPEKLNL